MAIKLLACLYNKEIIEESGNGISWFWLLIEDVVRFLGPGVFAEVVEADADAVANFAHGLAFLGGVER